MSQLISAYEQKREQLIFKLRARNIEHLGGEKISQLTLTELIRVWRWSEQKRRQEERDADGAAVVVPTSIR